MSHFRRLRPVRVAVLALALAAIAVGCGDDDDSAADTAADTTAAASVDTTASASSPVSVPTRDAGKLTVCSDIPYAPFEFNDDSGDVVGVDAELIRGISEGLGLEAVFVDTDFDGIFAALKAGQCDVIASSVSITDERKQQNDFTDGYYEINQSLLVRKGDEGTLDDLAALDGRTVAVQSGTTGADFAIANADANGYTVKEFTGADEMFTALDAQQVDAVLQDYPVNAYRAVASGTSVVSKTFEGEGEQYGFVVSKDNPELTTQLNAWLGIMREDGRYDAILEKYLGEGSS